MKITINGKTKAFKTPISIDEALDIEGYKGKLVAVAVNGNFIPKAQYSVSRLQDGDEIDIVSPMQGG